MLIPATLIFLAILAKSAFVLIPLTGFLLFCYCALVIRERCWSRGAAWSIPAAILVYVWLKKYTFLPERFFLHFPYFTLGLSYIFFRVLHLLIEAGEETRNPSKAAHRLCPLPALHAELYDPDLRSDPALR